MSVLKIKDQNGQWTDVLSIKGEKGDNGQDYVLTENDKQEIAQDVAELVDTPVDDVQINGTSIVQNGVAEIPIASTSTLGAVTCAQDYGVTVLSNGRLQTTFPSDAQLKSGSSNYRVITPTNQHKSVFYGLAKASGDTTQSESNNAVGIYTDEAKASIQSMLGVANKADILIVHIGTIIDSTNKIYQIDNTYTNIASALARGANVVINNDPEIFPYVGIATIDNNPVLAFGTSTTFNGTAVLSGYLILQNNTAMRVDQYTTIPTATSQLTNDSLVSDVQINGTSIVTDGVAEIPVAARNVAGLFNTKDASFYFDNYGYVSIERPSDNYIKTGADRARVPYISQQHLVVFYGLAKAAGSDEKDSTLPVGQYTDSAKTAIKNMLGVIDGGGTISETVTGTDPTISAQNNFRYMCGELYTLNFTPCVSGVCEVIFTSGATPTVLTLPDTVRMPAWWTGVEANTTYEISIVDGVYGAVMSWS